MEKYIPYTTRRVKADVSNNTIPHNIAELMINNALSTKDCKNAIFDNLQENDLA